MNDVLSNIEYIELSDGTQIRSNVNFDTYKVIYGKDQIISELLLFKGEDMIFRVNYNNVSYIKYKIVN